jgi:hypothetical protein
VSNINITKSREINFLIIISHMSYSALDAMRVVRLQLFALEGRVSCLREADCRHVT